MDTGAGAGDGFVEASAVELTECRADRVVAAQQPLPELENHVGVRHASALHAAGFAASRALIETALAGCGPLALRLLDSEIAYQAMGQGPLLTVAEPAGEEWGAAAGRLRAGEPVELTCAVRTDDEAGRRVVSLQLRWAVGPAAASA